jgi:hypothetical protein
MTTSSAPSSLKAAPAKGQDPELWMIRTSDLKLRGPITRAELLQKLEKGELAHNDEVCRKNHYWFALHEEAELLNQLGFQFSRVARGGKSVTGSDDEATQSEITQSRDGVEEEITDRGIKRPPASQAWLSPEAVTTWVVSSSESEPVISVNPVTKKVSPIRSAPEHSRGREDATTEAGMYEDSNGLQIWRWFAWILVVLSAFLVYAVLRRLQR